MGIKNKKGCAFIVLLLLGHLYSEAAKEDKAKNLLLIKKYENEYNQTSKIEDFGERLFQFRMIATEWSKKDVNSAFDWGNKPSISIDTSARFEMLVAAVSEMSRKSPKEAWSKVQEIEDQGERDSLRGLVIEIWAGEQYGEAEKWVAQQKDSDFRNNLYLRLIQGNKQQEWQNKLVKLYEAPNPDFVPILNILSQNASDEYIAKWILGLSLKNEIRNQLLKHLEEKLSAWAQKKPEEALKLLEKQDYDKETDYLWLAAFRAKAQADPIGAIKGVQAYSAPIRDMIFKGNLEHIIKYDPAAAFEWANRDQGIDEARLDALVQLQNKTKTSAVDPKTKTEIQSAIQEVQAKIAKEKKPTLSEIWAFVLQKSVNPDLAWGKMENLAPEQKQAIEENAKHIRMNTEQILAAGHDTKFFEKLFSDPKNLKNPQSPTNPQQKP